MVSTLGTLTHKRRQAMLYAAGVPDRHTMETAPQVGIASVWWEGNPCKYVGLITIIQLPLLTSLIACTVSQFTFTRRVTYAFCN